MKRKNWMFFSTVSLAILVSLSYLSCDSGRKGMSGDGENKGKGIKSPFVNSGGLFSADRLSYEAVTNFSSGAAAEAPGNGVCNTPVDSNIPLIGGVVSLTSGCLVHFQVAKFLSYSDMLNGFDPFMPAGGNILSPFSIEIVGDPANAYRFGVSNFETRKWYNCNASFTRCDPEADPTNSSYLMKSGATWYLKDWVSPTVLEFNLLGGRIPMTRSTEYLYMDGPETSNISIQRNANGLLLGVYDNKKARAILTVQYAGGFVSKLIGEFGDELIPAYKDGYLIHITTKGVGGEDIRRYFSYGPQRRLAAVLEPNGFLLGLYRSANGIYLGSLEGYFEDGNVYPKRETVMCYRIVGNSFRVVTSNSENFIKRYEFVATPRGHQVSTVSLHNATSANAYDALGQLTSTTAGGDTVTYAYSPAGHVKSATTHGYKNFDVLTWQALGTFALPKTMKDRNLGTYTYNYIPGSSRISSITDPKGNTISYTYNSSTVSQAANSLSPLTQVHNSVGLKTSSTVLGTVESWVFSPAHLLQSYTNTIGDVTSYTYDAKEQVTGVTGLGFSASATRDPSTGLIQSVTSEGVTTAYTRYPEGTVGDVKTYNVATEFKSHFRYDKGGYFGITGENGLPVTAGETLSSIPAPAFTCD